MAAAWDGSNTPGKETDKKQKKTYKENCKRRCSQETLRSSDKLLGMYKITYTGKAVCTPKKDCSTNVSPPADPETLHKQR